MTRRSRLGLTAASLVAAACFAWAAVALTEHALSDEAEARTFVTFMAAASVVTLAYCAVFATAAAMVFAGVLALVVPYLDEEAR